MYETELILLPVKNLPSSSCSANAIFYKRNTFLANWQRIRWPVHILIVHQQKRL